MLYNGCMADDKSFLNPSRLIASIDIPSGGVAADFGAGSGFFAIPLAARVAAEGKVYAFDIRPDLLAQLRSNARLRHLLNIEAVVADLELPRATHLKDAVADIVLVASILHQVGDKAAVLKEAARILKPGRMLVLIEWDQSKVAGGPPLPMRLAQAKARELGEAAGFQTDREIAAGSHHYCLLFRRQ